MYLNDFLQSLSERISVSAFPDDLRFGSVIDVCNENLQNSCDMVKKLVHGMNDVFS